MLLIEHLSFQLSNNALLSIPELSLTQGESLLVLGDNASGKSVLAQILAGNICNYDGKVSITEKFTTLSFELEAETLAVDRLNDRSDFMEEGVDHGRSAREIILDDKSYTPEELDEVISLLAIEKLLDKPFKILSTGETRKVLMARALMLKPQVMLLDEPYAGLDIGSQAHLSNVLNTLVEQGISIIIFDFYHQSLPSQIDNVIYMQEGSIVLSGKREQVIASEKWQQLNEHHYSLPHHLPDCLQYKKLDKNTPLVSLNNVSVSFEQKPVFNDISWRFEQGQHWRIIGPNGCGKSTLLAMISGDSPKAYGKDLHLFGVKRGSGESIWDIKRHYGVVSAQLHRDYRVPTTLIQVVLSGFYDSIGLYDSPTRYQVNIAREWLVLLGLEQHENTYFSQLSYGEQRLVLITRAVVKLPMILILDEPCQGLDNHNRDKVLALMDYIAANSKTHLIFVSHDIRDQLTCITHELEFLAQQPEQANQGDDNLGYVAKSTVK
ncbi:molybdate ABC transporter ATP-binding protein ModF [Litorilituus lipolyticus]|uniref:Molybdate ABC transporter ATP-binding protein ModF n=1 Tax=Litorilituus lipolyticus TaxID=2491017 RepID=A0A502L562_9GAMM|nr:molybdate ABC transporter ATP-binding protein ModF [Litorilituus lipolyticus]TPH18109.1 molybdate ABC transporter ATP-binding protein ModF [Litorilituus lipolyticus]